MKKLLIPIAVIACASIAVLCTACQQENTESEATTAPSITIIATADESTKDETATMPKITEENATPQKPLPQLRQKPKRKKRRTALPQPIPTVCLLSQLLMKLPISDSGIL